MAETLKKRRQMDIFKNYPSPPPNIDGDTVNIRGMIAIENQSSQSFEDVEVSFADFSHEFSDNASNYRGDPKQRMKKMNIPSVLRSGIV